MCDWIDNAVSLQLSHGDGQVYGYMHLACKIEINASLEEHRRAAEAQLD